jgi:hypothetical protein
MKGKTLKPDLLKLFAGILVLAALILIGYEGYKCLKIDDSDTYNESFRKVTFRNGKVALTDLSGRIRSEKVDDIYVNPYTSAGDTLTIFILNGNRGYLSNKSGKTIIPAQFEYAWHFDSGSGLAAVCLNGKVGFINKASIFVILPEYSFTVNSETEKTYEDLAEILNNQDDYSYEDEDEEDKEEPKEEQVVKGFIFDSGYCIIPGEDKYGLIDEHNKLLLSPLYDWISSSEHGFRIIKSGEKLGLFQVTTAKIVWPTRYSDIQFTERGILVEDILQNNPVKFIVNYDLKMETPVFDDVSEITTEETGEFTGFSKYTIGTKMGILDDLTGKQLCPAQFDEISYNSPGIFKAMVGDVEFFIDKNGEMLHSVYLSDSVKTNPAAAVVRP